MRIIKKQPNKSIDKKTQEDIKKLIISRIKVTSDDFAISIGSKDCTKKQMLKSVETEDELGQEIIETQMEYLRDMAKGVIYQQNNDN